MNLLDHNLLKDQSVQTPVASAPEPEAVPVKLTEIADQVAPVLPITDFQLPPIPPISVEEKPIELAHNSNETGLEFIQLGDGKFIEASEYRTRNSSIGVGDSNLEGSMRNHYAEMENGGSPYGDSSAIVPQNNQQLAQRRPISLSPQPTSGPDFPNELIANLNATSITKWMLMAGAMVAGSAVLVLVLRGLQTPSERMLAANQAIMRESTAKQQSMLTKQMGFVEKTGKQNAKLAANAKGSNNFCIGSCADTAPKAQATDPTEQGNSFDGTEAVEPTIKPDAAKLVAKWRKVTTDEKTLDAWAEKVVPGVKYGQLTSEDVKLALSIQ